MATANIKKRTGVKIKDIFVKKSVHIPSIPKPLPVVAPIPKMFEVKEPKTITKPLKKKTDLADKKVKSLFKHLNDSGIEQPDKLLDFVRWYALPRQLRTPETQEKLSEKIGIHKDTFVNWKRRAGFWDEVAIYRGQFGRSYVSDALYALIRHAKQTGDPRAVKLILQYFENWSEKVRTQDETPERELDPELQEQIRHAIHNIGLSTIKRGYETDEDEGLSTADNE